ncbi:MAG: diacylglycerol kinase [Micavibrio sp.]|nr:diacylglycerol kinase [Micavibrio sp.]
MKPGNTGITRIIKAAGYTRDGLIATFKTEAAFRQELGLAIVLVPLALFIAPSHLAAAGMIASVLLVLMVELLNSGIEAVVDRFGGELHPLSKHAKDAGSAAVFVALLNVAVVWLLCLF